MQAIRAIDMFCGAGGSSWGARLAGVQIVAGFDMWDLACKAYKDNFPEAQVYPCELEQLDLEDVERALGNIDLILASPECTNHSPAKGGVPRCEKSRETALQVARFAEVFRPRWIVVENVLSMRNWSRYEEFLKRLRDLGYGIRKQVLNAADFGVPQKRSRLFIICDRQQEPNPVKGSCKQHRTAASIVDQDGTYPYSRLRTERRAQPTLERAGRAIKALGAKESFLIVYYGSDGAGGWQRMDVPLRTITTLDRFAFVKPTDSGRVMRMLQPPELKAAMGMPKRFRIEHGTRRDRIKLIGNAVCPPVMRSVVKTLINTP
jgi:DNA (cytosine-5)-methyltransferase 1